MVDTYGDAAETFIQMGMLKAVERNDMAAFRGWQNIKFAMIDLWRLPAPGEPLH